MNRFAALMVVVAVAGAPSRHSHAAETTEPMAGAAKELVGSWDFMTAKTKANDEKGSSGAVLNLMADEKFTAVTLRGKRVSGEWRVENGRLRLSYGHRLPGGDRSKNQGYRVSRAGDGLTLYGNGESYVFRANNELSATKAKKFHGKWKDAPSDRCPFFSRYCYDYNGDRVEAMSPRGERLDK